MGPEKQLLHLGYRCFFWPKRSQSSSPGGRLTLTPSKKWSEWCRVDCREQSYHHALPRFVLPLSLPSSLPFLHLFLSLFFLSFPSFFSFFFSFFPAFPCFLPSSHPAPLPHSFSLSFFFFSVFRSSALWRHLCFRPMLRSNALTAVSAAGFSQSGLSAQPYGAASPPVTLSLGRRVGGGGPPVPGPLAGGQTELDPLASTAEAAQLLMHLSEVSVRGVCTVLPSSMPALLPSL